MADGITVITTPGNKSYFEKVARLKHTFHSENNLLGVVQVKSEIVQNKFHEIKGKNMTVQFLDSGPSSHVDENIIAYIPEKNILFQGDFFRVPASRNEPERLRDEGMIFYQKIKDKKLKFTQLVGAHGAIGDISDLEKAYQLRMQGNKS
jgi:flavorubredoxin